MYKRQVPDEDLYEQGTFPSSFNRDHKWTFTIFQEISWSSRSINILDLVKFLGKEADVVKVEQLPAVGTIDDRIHQTDLVADFRIGR